MFLLVNRPRRQEQQQSIFVLHSDRGVAPALYDESRVCVVDSFRSRAEVLSTRTKYQVNIGF